MSAALQSFLPFIILIVVFYLLLFLPEQRKNKKFKAMVDALKVGDEVLTRGGINGKVVNMKDEYIVIESGAEKTRIKMLKSAVSSIVNSKEEEKESK